jgi:DNA-binding LacI/PurR family transcriptional regulator
MNNPSIVSAKTRKAVEEAIEELNFHPNLLGRHLRQSRSGLIMVLVSNLNSPYYGKVIDAIQTTARARQYDVMLCQDLIDPQIAASYIRHLKQRTVDGLIILDNTVDNSMLGDIDYKRYPVVQCSQYCEKLPIPYVSIDDRAAMRRMVHYLISTGRRRIALLNGDRRFIYAKHRMAGYRDALSEAGIAVDKSLVRYIDILNHQSAIMHAREMFEREDRPDAIVGVADILAVAALKAAKQKGLQVPRDVSIASFDNTDFTILSEPAITSVVQPRHELGTESCRMLMEIMDNPKIPRRQILLESDLVIRESTMYTGSNVQPIAK